MGIYLSAVENQARFAEELAMMPFEKPTFKNIGLIAIRADVNKGLLLQRVLGGHGLASEVIQASWDEDIGRMPYLSSSKSAAKKVTDLDPSNDIRIVLGPQKLARNLVISIATDVLQFADKEVLHKPTGLSREEIESQLLDGLTGEGNKEFNVKIGAAALALDSYYSDDNGQGLVLDQSSRFNISSLMPEEIDFYLYGLKGKKGNYPEAAEQILSELVDQYQLGDADIQLIQRGLTTNELRQTNGGLRWLHPILQKHITAIDGISADREQFNYKLNRLFSMLTGVAPDFHLVLEHLSMVKQKTRWQIGSIYPDLPGNWQELVVSGKTDPSLILSVDTNDAQQIRLISELTQANFQNAATYADLDLAHRQSYQAANSPKAMLDHFQNPKNLCILVSQELSGGNINGYISVRRNGSERIAQIRRIHTSLTAQHNGVGKSLLNRAEEIARENGIQTMEVVASGTSDQWFYTQGFSLIKILPNTEGVFNGIGSPPSQILMGKKL